MVESAIKVGITVDDPDSIVADAQEADRLGFDFLGCGEHVFFHGPTPNSFALLAAAAAVTEHVRLVSSIALLPLYPAAVVAKLAATIDRIACGRFELGIGSGGEFPAEFHAVGVNRSERFRRTDEGLEVIRRLFDGENVDFEGKYSRLHAVKLNPPPFQRGGPPIWIGGRGTGALRRVARYADRWMPYMVEPRHVRDGLADIRAQAPEYGRAAEDVSAALFGWCAVDRDGEWARATGVSVVSEAYQQDFGALADRYLLLGEPDTVIARLRTFAEAGVDTVLLQVAAKDRADRSRVVATLADCVLPALREG